MRLHMNLNTDGSDFRAFVLSDPYRIIVDLPSFEWRAHTIEKPKNFVISDIRQGPLQKGISRIVFDLKAPVQIRKATMSDSKDLIIDVTTTTPEVFRAHKNDIFGSLSVNTAIAPEMKRVLSNLSPQDGFLKPASLLTPTENNPKPLFKPEYKAPEKESDKPLIVIDPGHGGIDPGAIGADNQKEKDVVLALGLDLRDTLLSSGRYRVEMTRSKDTFLALKERVNYARSKGADLFISLHADSIHKPDVHGTSVYTLSKEASDAQTAKLAEKENKADLIAGASAGPTPRTNATLNHRTEISCEIRFRTDRQVQSTRPRDHEVRHFCRSPTLLSNARCRTSSSCSAARAR